MPTFRSDVAPAPLVLDEYDLNKAEVRKQKARYEDDEFLVDVSVPSKHAMGVSLNNYVLPKIHQDIKRRKWSRIIVRGKYDRNSPAVVAETEKSEKPFNFHRPTATVMDENTLVLNCFPGKDYVRHYAELVGTYLMQTGGDLSVVRYRVPSVEDCMAPFLSSNLRDMGKVDCVIIGYVHQILHRSSLQIPHPTTWEGRTSDQMFGWHTQRRHNATIALLGFLPSFWGDISSYLVKALQTLNGVKCIIYVGKGGSLDPSVRPNERLATGSKSLMQEQRQRPMHWKSTQAAELPTRFHVTPVRWHNVLLQDIQDNDRNEVVQQGNHINVYSPLVESRQWVDRWGNSARWVDCEVGYIAKQCLEGATEFGYLHVVSDNVRQAFQFDLSNEEMEEVKVLRRKLFRSVDDILESFIERWTSNHRESKRDVAPFV